MALEFIVREYEHSAEKASLLSNILQILFKSCLPPLPHASSHTCTNTDTYIFLSPLYFLGIRVTTVLLWLLFKDGSK